MVSAAWARSLLSSIVRVSPRFALLGAVSGALCCGSGRFYRGHEVSGPLQDRAANTAEDQATRTQVAAALEAIALSRAGSERLLGERVAVGPALWAMLVRGDPTLQAVGNDSVSAVETSEDFGYMQWYMRTFSDEQAKRRLVANALFRSLVTTLGSGVIRPAQAAEREAFHRLTPVELTGRPLTVVEKAPHRLVVYVEGDRITWLDLLSGWVVKKAPAGAPRPSEIIPVDALVYIPAHGTPHGPSVEKDFPPPSPAPPPPRL